MIKLPKDRSNVWDVLDSIAEPGERIKFKVILQQQRKCDITVKVQFGQRVNTVHSKANRADTGKANSQSREQMSQGNKQIHKEWTENSPETTRSKTEKTFHLIQTTRQSVDPERRRRKKDDDLPKGSFVTMWPSDTLLSLFHQINFHVRHRDDSKVFRLHKTSSITILCVSLRTGSVLQRLHLWRPRETELAA